MAGSKEGGQKAAATTKAKHGSDFYVMIGRKGGSAKRKAPRWFEAHPELAQKAGAIGGKRSSRKGIKTGMGKSRYKYKKVWNDYEATE
jgi:general stress protein YciG